MDIATARGHPGAASPGPGHPLLRVVAGRLQQNLEAVGGQGEGPRSAEARHSLGGGGERG